MSEEIKLAYSIKEEYSRWFKQAKENDPEKISETIEKLRRFDKLVEGAANERKPLQKVEEDFIPVQEYSGEGYDLLSGEDNDSFAKEHFDEIAEAVEAFFLEKYKTEVIVHNAVGNVDGATVFVESVGEPHFHTFCIVPIDLKNEQILADFIFTLEGEVENAIIQGLVAMALDEEITNLNNYLEGLTEKYPIVGIREEAINNVMATGYTTPYYFINATRNNFGYLFDAYMKNPDITKEEVQSLFDKNSYDPEDVDFVIKFFMSEPGVEPDEEILYQIKHDIETLEGLPRGMYSIILNDNLIDKTSARGEKENTLEISYPNYIIRE